MSEDIKKLFVDIDLKFTSHPVTGDVTKRTGTAAISQSIRNLVLTAAGEFVGELQIGGGVGRLLFKNNNALLAYTLQDKITQTIERFEPRVKLKEVLVNNTSDKAAIFVTVRYYVLGVETVVTESIRLERFR